MLEELLSQGGNSPFVFLILIVQSALIIVSIATAIAARLDSIRMREYYTALAEYLGNGDSRDILHDLAEIMQGMDYESKLREKDISDLYAIASGCIQKVAIVRYNAFNSAGSELSFSVALLDAEDNGIVLSCLHGRDASATYAKPIRTAASEYVLTNEELAAIGHARREYDGRSAYGADIGGR
jgi:hypothetical protein